MTKKLSKRMKSCIKDIDFAKSYEIREALQILKTSCGLLKFDASVELSIKLGIDIQKLGSSIRSMVSLPAGTGQSVAVAVICKEEKIEEAKNAGADFAGSLNLIEEIKSGNTNFKVCIATPDMMGQVGQIARILGPKGMMPNPKLGTVTFDIASAVKQFKSGRIEFKASKEGIINVKAGKMSFNDEDILSNIKAIISAVEQKKPEKSKGKYLERAFISYTMGPALRLNQSYISN